MEERLRDSSTWYHLRLSSQNQPATLSKTKQVTRPRRRQKRPPFRHMALGETLCAWVEASVIYRAPFCSKVTHTSSGRTGMRGFSNNVRDLQCHYMPLCGAKYSVGAREKLIIPFRLSRPGNSCGPNPKYSSNCMDLSVLVWPSCRTSGAA